jgi:hypothetical protein
MRPVFIAKRSYAALKALSETLAIQAPLQLMLDRDGRIVSALAKLFVVGEALGRHRGPVGLRDGTPANVR